MTPRPSQATGTFDSPRLAVRWQGRRANFLESLQAALRGPRVRGEIDPAASFFRLRIARVRPPGRGIAGSFLWHAILLCISIPVSQLAEPTVRLPLPQVDITWYGPVTDVAPIVAPQPKKANPAPREREPQPEVVARAYNPKMTVVYKPPHPDNTRQLLIEPDAPPEMPKGLAALPNAIRWASESQVRPTIAVHPANLRPELREEPAPAVMRAPAVLYATPPAGPVDIAASASTRPQPPMPITASAVHAVRAPSPRPAVAIAPSLPNAAPPARPPALDGEGNKGPEAPLPAVPDAIRADPARSAPASAAAPNLEPAASRLVALSLRPGSAPPPPGNASAPMSIGPHVAGKDSPGVPAPSAVGEAGGRGPASTSFATPGPAGLFILNEGGGPARPEPPRPSALPRIAPLTPESLRALSDSRPAGEPAAAGHAAKEDLAHRVLGPWRIHTLLMNMPNLTSSSGSWVLNFASPLGAKVREEKDIIAPLPVHSVDPEYPPSVKEEGVEGQVVLYAVIEPDGTVSEVRLVQGLDPELDHNAEIAFSQWRFDPALLNNQPIALRVLVTVPFHYTTQPE